MCQVKRAVVVDPWTGEIKIQNDSTMAYVRILPSKTSFTNSVI
jgi:hypothetical protein